MSDNNIKINFSNLVETPKKISWYSDSNNRSAAPINKQLDFFHGLFAPSFITYIFYKVLIFILKILYPPSADTNIFHPVNAFIFIYAIPILPLMIFALYALLVKYFFKNRKFIYYGLITGAIISIALLIFLFVAIMSVDPT